MSFISLDLKRYPNIRKDIFTEILFVQKFKLLGSMALSMLAYNPTDDAEKDARINSAKGAFQSIRKHFKFFSAAVPRK